VNGSTGEVAGWGAVVRRLREERGWTQGQLAYHAGVDQSRVSKIESGAHRDTRLSTVTRLAAALGVGVDVLLGHELGPPPLGRAVLRQLEATVGQVVRAELDRALRPRRADDQQPSELGHAGLPGADYGYLKSGGSGLLARLVRAAAPSV
jgi:transcriptional regulator with XRE-family HTH domain